MLLSTFCMFITNWDMLFVFIFENWVCQQLALLLSVAFLFLFVAFLGNLGSFLLF